MIQVTADEFERRFYQRCIKKLSKNILILDLNSPQPKRASLCTQREQLINEHSSEHLNDVFALRWLR